MNQILYTGNTKKPASIKSIIKFFSFCALLLGIVFIGKGSYALYSNYTANKLAIDTSPASIQFDQESNNAIITASHSSGISKIKYHWNEDEDMIVQGDLQKTVIIDNINIPTNVNSLIVTIIDGNGKETIASHEYSYAGIAIELAVVDNAYIKITASDLSGLSYITYKWNSDEEVKAFPDGDNKVIEQTTEIPSGLNTLTVTAVNINNETITKTQDVKGVHPPQIQVYHQQGYLVVMVNDEEGIDKIIQKVNDEEKVIEVNGEKTKAYKYNITAFENPIVSITAVDVEGAESVFKGKL